MNRFFLCLLTLVFFACNNLVPGKTETGNIDVETGIPDDDTNDSDTNTGDSDTAPTDGDGDGVDADEDCNDADASVYPGATEVCDGIDNNCDGNIDEGVEPTTWCLDDDNDNYGDPATTTTACSAPTGYVADCTDCDDLVMAVNPGATEVCDGQDNDCDDQVDEDTTSVWYWDTDGDGYGGDFSSWACEQPKGYVANSGDCDDADATVYPGAPELCEDNLDNDCDGTINEDCAGISPPL